MSTPRTGSHRRAPRMFRLFHNAKVHANPATGWTPQATWHSHDATSPGCHPHLGRRIVAVGDYRRLKDMAPLGTGARASRVSTCCRAWVRPGHIHSAICYDPSRNPICVLRLVAGGPGPAEAAVRGRPRGRMSPRPGSSADSGTPTAGTFPVFPDKHNLDSICPDIPMALGSLDWHTLWLNSRRWRLWVWTATSRTRTAAPTSRTGTVSSCHQEAAGVPIRGDL